MDRFKADVAVIGGGSGGLTAATGAARLGLKVVLFERAAMGGDCLNYGCVPSKALIATANLAQQCQRAARMGVAAGDRVDFPAVMAHVKGAIAAIAPHDSVERLEGLGVQVIPQTARFIGNRELQAGDLRVQARKIVVATGSRPRIPAIPGLAATAYLTNETVFDLHELPQHLVVIGGGAIGLELGQAFHRLGSEVTILEAGQPLAHEDRDVVAPLLAQLENDGLRIMSRAEIKAIERGPSGPRVNIVREGRPESVDGSHLLVAVGRTPNIEDLNLDVAGVAHNEHGLVTDAGLRSIGNRNVFAAGDVAGREAFTHAAGAQAVLVIVRAFFGLPARADKLLIPRVTYTDPEVASVGLTEGQAREQHGRDVRTVVARYAENDRAVTEGDTRGFAKLMTTRHGRILGVSIVGACAGELIQPWVLALGASIPLRKVASMVAPYPTRGELNQRLAAAWFAPKIFSPGMQRFARLISRVA